MRTISRPILVVAAGCGLSVIAGGAPVVAKTCPSGQFLQVSKGKCISKSSARELGIAGKAGQAAAKPKAEKSEAKREKAGETTVARSAPAASPDKAASDKAREGEPETTLASAAPAMAGQSLGYAQSEPLTVRRNIAPFGALQFGGFK